MIFTVAIDGPAAAGKGTIGRALANRFGFAHLDTGALYRAVGVKGGDPIQAARSLTPAVLARDDLRTLAAGQAASRVAVIPEVRAALLEFQRRFARRTAARCWMAATSARSFAPRRRLSSMSPPVLRSAPIGVGWNWAAMRQRCWRR